MVFAFGMILESLYHCGGLEGHDVCGFYHQNACSLTPLAFVFLTGGTAQAHGGRNRP